MKLRDRSKQTCRERGITPAADKERERERERERDAPKNLTFLFFSFPFLPPFFRTHFNHRDIISFCRPFSTGTSRNCLHNNTQSAKFEQFMMFASLFRGESPLPSCFVSFHCEKWYVSPDALWRKKQPREIIFLSLFDR